MGNFAREIKRNLFRLTSFFEKKREYLIAIHVIRQLYVLDRTELFILSQGFTINSILKQ